MKLSQKVYIFLIHPDDKQRAEDELFKRRIPYNFNPSYLGLLGRNGRRARGIFARKGIRFTIASQEKS